MINLKIVCDDKKYIPAYANETDACMDLKVKIDVEKNEDKWVLLIFVSFKVGKSF